MKRTRLARGAGAVALAGLLTGACAQAAGSPAPTPAAAPAPVVAALGDLGLALLRASRADNTVVSPVAVAIALGMIQAGASGPAEHEIEALFGAGPSGATAMRQQWPALVARLAAEGAAGETVKTAARIWVDRSVAQAVPAPYKERMARRYGADAMVLSFAEPEVARAQINRWTAERTAGRVAELLPAGSVAKSTLVALTSAVHFRSPWAQAFAVGQTEPRAFTTSAGAGAPVPTMLDERAVAQAQVDGVQVYALPFRAGYDLVLALPAAGASLDALLQGSNGESLARWRAALHSERCSFALPKFSFAPKAGSIKSTLVALGVRTAFLPQADLRPMLGRDAGQAQVDDIQLAAGIAIDEQGGEAVAATAATVKPKSLAAAAPRCAVDRAFAFFVVHRDSGTPLFMGRVGDPARAE